MCRNQQPPESSIQLCYQNALVLYQFIYPPMRELYYGDTFIQNHFSNFISPTAQWILLLAFQLLSICLSGYSTFAPIVENSMFKCFKEKSSEVFKDKDGNEKLFKNLSEEEKESLKSPTGLLFYLTQLLLVIFHIIFATGVVYMIRVEN